MIRKHYVLFRVNSQEALKVNIDSQKDWIGQVENVDGTERHEDKFTLYCHFMVSDLCEVSFQKIEMSLSIKRSKERSLDALDIP